MRNIKNLKINKEFEYLFFSRAYLILAYRGLEEVLKKVKTGKFVNPFGETKPIDLVYERNYLLAPAIYDLKHAIEIFIKTLTQFLDIQAEEKHDFKALFQKLRKKISGQTVDDLENLVLDYYNNELLKNKLGGNIKMEDKMNDVFRYPDNKAKIELNFFNILPEFTEDDLRKIQTDIKEFNRLFYLIGEKIVKEKYGPRPKLAVMEKASNLLKS